MQNGIVDTGVKEGTTQEGFFAKAFAQRRFITQCLLGLDVGIGDGDVVALGANLSIVINVWRAKSRGQCCVKLETLAHVPCEGQTPCQGAVDRTDFIFGQALQGLIAKARLYPCQRKSSSTIQVGPLVKLVAVAGINAACAHGTAPVGVAGTQPLAGYHPCEDVLADDVGQDNVVRAFEAVLQPRAAGLGLTKGLDKVGVEGEDVYVFHLAAPQRAGKFPCDAVLINPLEGRNDIGFGIQQLVGLVQLHGQRCKTALLGSVVPLG